MESVSQYKPDSFPLQYVLGCIASTQSQVVFSKWQVCSRRFPASRPKTFGTFARTRKQALCFTPWFSIQIIYMPLLQFRYCADAKADNHKIVSGESTESRQTGPRIFETCSLEQNVSASDHATNPEESKQCTRK